MSDGNFTTVDNRRVLAAQQAGPLEVLANVHNEPVSDSLKSRGDDKDAQNCEEYIFSRIKAERNGMKLNDGKWIEENHYGCKTKSRTIKK